MISTTAILDTRKIGKKGYPIKIRVFCNKEKKHAYWNIKQYQKSDKLKITGDISDFHSKAEKRARYCNHLNLSLKEAMPIIQNGIPEDTDIEIVLLKKRLEVLEKKSGAMFLDFFDTIIEERKQEGRVYTSLVNTKNQLVNFLGAGNDIRINSIDYEFLNKFKLHKKKYGKGQGGLKFYFSTMRIVYKEAQRRTSLNVKKDNPFIGFIKSTGKKVEALHTIEDLTKLFSFIPRNGTTNKSKSIMKRNIDIFFFQFCIGGHDYADISNLKWSNIKNDRVSFYRFKLRNFEGEQMLVDNPLNEYCKAIIEKYGTPNNDRIFGFIPDPNNEIKYSAFNKLIGKSLGRICNTLEIPKIKTKTARYLFRSMAGEIGIDTLRIDQIQGRKTDGISSGYQRRFNNGILDQEINKVLLLLPIPFTLD